MDQNVEEKSGNGMKLRAPVGWTIAIAHVMSNVVNFIPTQLCFHSRFYRTEILAIRKNMKKEKTFYFYKIFIYAMISTLFIGVLCIYSRSIIAVTL